MKKFNTILVSFALLVPLHSTARITEPELLALTYIDNEETEECPISGDVSVLLEYDLKDADYAELFLQVMTGDEVISEFTTELYSSENPSTVSLNYIDCATDIITSF